MKNPHSKLNLSVAGKAATGVCRRGAPAAGRNSNGAFSLIEIMLVVSLLTLIMVALMSVFSSTQTAFKASITQTDVLEGSRSAMDLITGDFRQMAASGAYNSPTLANGGLTPVVSSTFPSYFNYPYSAINFWVSTPTPTISQSLIGSQGPEGTVLRSNFVQSVFILTYENQLWRGIGYFVDTNSSEYVDPLYRYDSGLCTNLPARPSPEQIFTNFSQVVSLYSAPNNVTNFDTLPYGYVSHLLDGVLHFNVRAYDPNGSWLTNNNGSLPTYTNVLNATFYYPAQPTGEVPLYFCSNTLPASVEIQMGVLEDHVLKQAGSYPLPLAASNYLAQQAGTLHLFRQRVTIPAADLTAFQ